MGDTAEAVPLEDRKKGRVIFRVEWFIRSQKGDTPWSKGVWYTYSSRRAKQSYYERVETHQEVCALDGDDARVRGRLGTVTLQQCWVEDAPKGELILFLLHGFGIIDGPKLKSYCGMSDPQFKEGA